MEFLPPFPPPGAGQCGCQTAEHPVVEITDRHCVPGARAVRLHPGRKHRVWRQQPHRDDGGDRGGS